jgi:thioredoxin reductase
MVDVLVVGAGPVGLAAALWAKRLGLSHLVLEKGTVAHTIYRFPRDMVFFSEAKNIEIGGHPLVAHGPKPTRKEALLYYQKVAEREGLQVKTYTEALAVEGREGAFRVRARDLLKEEEEAHAARYVVVATGYFDRPNRLGVPGEELPHVRHRYEEAALFFGKKVAVVGGSNSAVEAALDLYRGGARVTLVHRGPWVRPGVKYWLLPDFQNRVKEGASGRSWRPGWRPSPGRGYGSPARRGGSSWRPTSSWSWWAIGPRTASSGRPRWSTGGKSPSSARKGRPPSPASSPSAPAPTGPIPARSSLKTAGRRRKGP